METQEIQTAGAVLLQEIAKACNEEVNAKEAKVVKGKKKKSSCQKLGQDKHACCERKIQEHRGKAPPNGDPPVEGEQAYNRPKFEKGKAVQPVDTNPVPMNRNQAISSAIASAGAGASRKAISSAIGAALGGKVFPDAAILGPKGEKTFVDFKFACPESHRSKRKKARKNYRPPRQSPSQQAAHDALGQATSGGKSMTIQL